MISFNGTTEISLGLTVKDIKRAVLPPVKNKFVTRSGVDGAIDFGADLDIREFTITFQSKDTLTLEELQDLRRDVALWLFPNDRFAKELIFDDEPTVYYMAKVDNRTDIDQILEYGSFEVKFLCPDVSGFSIEEIVASPITEFIRNSTAFDQYWSSVGVNQPRYTYPKGIIVEQEVTNSVANPDFLHTGSIPDDYSELAFNATGTHYTAGFYRATISSSTADGASFGIIETPGNWHVFGGASHYCGQVYCRVASGNVKAQVRVGILDSGYSTYYNLFSTTSTTWERFYIDDQSAGSDYAVALGFEACAISSGDTGSVEFLFPQLEIGSRYHNLWYNDGTKELDLVAFGIKEYPDNWKIGVTFKPLWGSSDVQASVNDAHIWNIYNSDYANMGVKWKTSTSQFIFFIKTFIESSLAVTTPSFDAYDEIKILIEKSSDGTYTISLNVNGGTIYTNSYIYSSALADDPLTFFVGKYGHPYYTTQKFANGIIYDLEYDPDNYFGI